MSERKPHIVIQGFAQSEDYKWPGRGPEKKAPREDRTPHGQALAQQYSSVQAKFDELKTSTLEPITKDKGIYVEVTGLPYERLNLDSLNNRTFRLSSCKLVNDREVAVIFIHESKRQALANKISEYIDPDRDSSTGPRNFALLDNIESIKLADLSSLFTDDLSEFPNDPNQETWWEIWLKKPHTLKQKLKL